MNSAVMFAEMNGYSKWWISKFM